MYRFARVSRFAAFLSAMLLWCAGPLSAQESSTPDQPIALLTDASLERAVSQLVQVNLAAGSTESPPNPFGIAGLPSTRPRALLPLYVSFASLQGLDAHSTTRALSRGAVEGNPLMRGLAAHPVGLVAVKAAATTAVVYAGEKMWKRNKVAAVVFMVAANSAMAWVVQHNYRAVR